MPSTGDELNIRCYRILYAAEKALRKVLPDVETSSVKASSYTIKGRTKTKKDIYDKVIRKREGTDGKPPKPAYEPEDVTDAAGLRVVTLFQPDMIEVVSHLLKMISHDENVAHSPFHRGDLREVLIFTNRPDKDPLSIAGVVHQTVISAGFGNVCKPPEASESGYSSVHLIVTADVEVEGADNKTRVRPFPLEIQVRTVFEDAWGEIDHKLRYTPIRGKAPGRMETWGPHLNALKLFVDGCTQYADVIKRQAIDDASVELAPRLLPIESVRDALRQFADYPEPIQIDLRLAYSARERMTNATTAEERAQFAEEAIQEYGRIERNASKAASDGDNQAKKLVYYMKLEQAFAAAQGKDPDPLAVASIYEALDKEYPNDPVILYRWAALLGRANRHADSIPIFERGLDALGNDWSGHWLRSSLPRLLAFAIWRISEKEIDPVQRLQFLGQCFALAQRAVADATPGTTHEKGALNSAVYFVAEAVTVAEKHSLQWQVPPEAGGLLIRFRNCVHVPSSRDIRHLDTLCRAEVVLAGDREAAAKVAARILMVIEKFDADALGEDDADILDFARRHLGPPRSDDPDTQ